MCSELSPEQEPTNTSGTSGRDTYMPPETNLSIFSHRKPWINFEPCFSFSGKYLIVLALTPDRRFLFPSTRFYQSLARGNIGVRFLSQSHHVIMSWVRDKQTAAKCPVLFWSRPSCVYSTFLDFLCNMLLVIMDPISYLSCKRGRSLEQDKGFWV